MRILVSAYACEPGRGSEPNAAWHWVEALANQGHQVLLLTRSTGRSKIEHKVQASAANSIRVVYVDVPSKLQRLYRGQFGVLADYVLWQWLATRAAARLIDRFDIVHHVSWGSLKGGSFMGKLGKPFVFGPIGGGQITPPGFTSLLGDAGKGEARRSFATHRLLGINPLARSALRQSSRVLCTNQATLDLAAKYATTAPDLFLDVGLPEEYIPHTIPVRINSPGFNLLWVGRLYPIKAVRLALEALAFSDVEVTLTIIGDGPQRNAVLGWIAELNLDLRVQWLGQVAWDDVKGAYSQADAFLFTSLRDSFGAQVLEAMAHGLPVVTLDHHGVHDFLPVEAAIKVPVSSPSQVARELARSVDLLYRSPVLRQQMGEAGQKFSREHTWPKKAKRMTGIYAELFQMDTT